MNEQLIARLRRHKNRTLALSRTEWVNEAIALMDEAAAALEAVPPREPTPEMIEDGRRLAFSDHWSQLGVAEADIWRVMYDAAPKGQP